MGAQEPKKGATGEAKGAALASAPEPRGQQRDPARIDGVLASFKDQVTEAANGGHGAVDESTHRGNLITQIDGVQSAVLTILNKGTERGIRALSKVDAPRHSSLLSEALGYASAMVVAGVAGPIAMRVAKGLAEQRVKKAVEDAVKEGLKRGLKTSPSKGSRDMSDLIEAFHVAVDKQIVGAVAAMNAELVHVNDALARLDTNALETVAAQLQSQLETGSDDLLERVANQTMIGWTNFLAQAKHGAMGAWDLWESHGSGHAFPLEGAKPAPKNGLESRSITAGNIAPGARVALDHADDDEHFGVLEIAMSMHGAFIQHHSIRFQHGYGMRLENVGPKVRELIKSLGTVRQAAINKIIRLYDQVTLHTIEPVGSILITADGYVRSLDMGSATLVHPDVHPPTLKEMAGIEPRTWRINVAANDAQARRLAEIAQDLPLSYLES